MAKIYIKCEGGLVRDCFSDVEDLEVIVIDMDDINDNLDCFEEIEDMKKLNEKCHEEIENETVKIVY